MPNTIDTNTNIAPTRFIVASDAALAPMSWATSLAGGGAAMSRRCDGVDLTATTGSTATLVTAVAPKARVAVGGAFRDRCLATYRAIHRALDESPHGHIVRMWNHIPGIHDPLDAECDRYMHFNAGRFAAMCEWFGGAENIPQFVPAASGIGHDGQDLVVHALAMSEPGTPVENPQQVPAFRYSKRYGPLPPCFARATRLTVPEHALLIAGTAAITGEVSRHVGDLHRQFDLTIENLRILMRLARLAGADEKNRDPLNRMQETRVYVLRSQDISIVGELARAVFTPRARIELVRADLCRSDLLVEIEGRARLS